MEIIFEALVMLLFVIPGAIVRWILFGCKKPLKEYIYADVYMNGGIGIITVALIVVFIKYILSN